MLDKLVRNLLGTIAWRLGWLLTLAGLIPPGMQAFDTYTTKPAVAVIEKIGQICQKQTCIVEKCNWKRISCKSAALLKASGENIRRKRLANLSFPIENGKASAWVHFSKLELPEAKPGETLDIVYRGPAPYYVSRPFILEATAIGLLISFVGLMLLASTRTTRKPSAPGRPHPQPQRAPQSVTTLGAPGYRRAVERNTGWL